MLPEVDYALAEPRGRRGSHSGPLRAGARPRRHRMADAFDDAARLGIAGRVVRLASRISDWDEAARHDQVVPHHAPDLAGTGRLTAQYCSTVFANPCGK